MWFGRLPKGGAVLSTPWAEVAMTLDPRLLDLLCCPAEEEGEPCHGPLTECPEGLRCERCGRSYPVEDGIPVLLPECGRKVL